MLTDHDRQAQRAGLMASVLDAPADDTPRLVLADWLMENGEPEWGEFIVVQIELARLEGEQFGCAGKVIHGVLHETDPRERHPHHDDRCHDPRPELRRREQELFQWGTARGECGLPLELYDGYHVHFVEETAKEIRPQQDGPFRFRFRWSRGFVSRVELATADFLDHAAALFGCLPLESVHLTDLEPLCDDPTNSRSPWTWYNAEYFHPIAADDRSNVPTELYACFDRNGCIDGSRGWIDWRAREEAVQALSAAAVKLGRAAVLAAREETG